MPILLGYPIKNSSHTKTPKQKIVNFVTCIPSIGGLFAKKNYKEVLVVFPKNTGIVNFI